MFKGQTNQVTSGAGQVTSGAGQVTSGAPSFPLPALAGGSKLFVQCQPSDSMSFCCSARGFVAKPDSEAS